MLQSFSASETPGAGLEVVFVHERDVQRVELRFFPTGPGQKGPLGFSFSEDSE
jgi:hypothetical protein